MALRRAGLVLLTGLLLVLGFGSCADSAAPTTELIVVVDSDLAVPSALDELSVHASSPDGSSQTATASLGAGQEPLPRSLVLRHAAGPLGPLTIRVEGKRAGASVVTRDAEASFVVGKSLVLPLHLARACRNQRCGERESCTEHGCADVAIDSAALDEWSGEKPRLEVTDAGDELDAGEPEDASAPSDAAASDAGRRDASAEAGAGDAGGNDAAMCVSKPEQCNGADDNCNGRIDDGFNLDTDVMNCGRCGMACNTRRSEVCCRGICSRACM